MLKTYEERHLKSVDDFISMMEETLNYLEKANGNNLGDFTDYGKAVNAGYNNYTLYWKWYNDLGYGNYQAQAYCAGYVSVMMCVAFGQDTAEKLLCGKTYINCQVGYNTFKAAGKIVSKPRIGDVVFFWNSSLNRYGHTGVVVGIDDNGGGYTTIEANTSAGNDIVIRNGGATCRKHYTYGGRVVAFGRIDYEKYGIALHKENISIITYNISTGVKGLIMVANVNVRSTPRNGSVIGSIKSGEKFYPTLKTFVNGDPWFFVSDKNGWVSGKYCYGWIQEKDYGNKWWYVYSGYTYDINKISVIDNVPYYFDSSGYLFIGTITFATDENGALKM